MAIPSRSLQARAGQELEDGLRLTHPRTIDHVQRDPALVNINACPIHRILSRDVRRGVTVVAAKRSLQISHWVLAAWNLRNGA